MNLLYIIIGLLLLFYTFVFALKQKLNFFEKKIIILFSKRNNIIACIYETTKKDFIRHSEIFNEVLKLKKINFLENKINVDIQNMIYTQQLIHNELDFIFNIADKHIKLNKNYKFLYIKDILIDQSIEIGKNLELYKKITIKYNFLIFIKNLTILGLLIPLKKLNSI